MSETKSVLSRSAQVVQDALARKGLNFHVVELSASTRTAQDAATAVGCEVAQIVKSLLFRTKETHEPLLLLTSGSNRVNEKVVAANLGSSIEKADADFTRAVTGFAIGGIPPVGHKQAIRTIIDQDLLQHQECWAAAGTPNAVFKLESSELVNLTDGVVMSVTG